MLKDDVIYLRAPEPQSDIDAMFRWENDDASWVDGRTRAPMSRFRLWDYLTNYSSDILASGQARFVICSRVAGAESEDVGLPIGCIDLYDVDALNRKAGVAVYIDSDNRRKGYAARALTLLAEYCRRDLGLHQLWAVVSVENSASRALFSRCGFAVSGRMRSWIRCADAYTDAFMLQRLLTD